jgi:hypothetical protein
MAPRAKDSNEEIRKLTAEGQRSSAIVIERLEQLVKKGVIAEYDMTFTPVLSNGGNMPRIIWTVERLLAEGHLAGLEDAVKSFCYLIGKASGSQRAVNNKQAK